MHYTASPEFLGLQAAVAGRYSLDAEIGRGGMGIIYRAMDVTLDRVVAIKLLPPGYAGQAHIRERFLREARTAARLSHPNVVPIFAVEEAGGYVFFVMAHVEGVTLAERVAQSGPLLPPDTVRVFREVAWALGYAHAQGIVHRDVKPDNVMLEAGSGRALVLDFGIAGAEAETEDDVLGTPHFMSPEQAAGEPTGPASDIYSFGATMFYALTGRPPFPGASAPEIVAHHVRTPPPRVSDEAPGTPGRLSAIVDQCLRKEPEERPGRAEDVAEALASAVQARKEVPVPVRAFVTRVKQRRGGPGSVILLAYLGGVVLIPLGIVMGSALGSTAVMIYGLATLGLIVGLPTALAASRVRQLLRAGFSRADLVRAFEEDYRDRCEELPFIYGAGNDATVSRLRRISLAGWIGAGVLALSSLGQPLLVPWAVLSASVGLIAQLVSNRRSAGQERRRVTFWKGRFGRWLFKLAGWRLERDADAPRLTHRPTEMALGLSVLGLYEALPAPTRKALGDLPSVVAGLETDAERMRDRVRDLDDLLAGASRDGTGRGAGDAGPPGDRDRAMASVRAARDRAAGRLADAVAALETLRVDLLRIRAGEGTLDHVTENLGAARDLSAQVERLLAAEHEIDQEVLR